MRHTTQLMLGVLLVAGHCCQSACAQESTSHWWPFSQQKQSPSSTAAPAATMSAPAAESIAPPLTTAAPQTPTTTLPPSDTITPVGPQTTAAQTAIPRYAPLPEHATTATPDQSSFSNPFANVTWPQMKMPELPRPQMPQLWPKREEVDAARNTWVEKSPDPAKPSPLQAAKDGVRRVGDSTRNAWHKTVDAITPGDPAPAGGQPQVASRNAEPSFWKRMFGRDEPQPQGPRTVTEWMAQDRLDP